VISRPSRSVITSASQPHRPWQLTFEARTAPEIEPLMGWTAGTDPLTQVCLSFPTLEASMAYAQRQGLRYRLSGSVEGAGVIFRPQDEGDVSDLSGSPRLVA
jgi:hypothetical protein